MQNLHSFFLVFPVFFFKRKVVTQRETPSESVSSFLVSSFLFLLSSQQEECFLFGFFFDFHSGVVEHSAMGISEQEWKELVWEADNEKSNKRYGRRQAKKKTKRKEKNQKKKEGMKKIKKKRKEKNNVKKKDGKTQCRKPIMRNQIRDLEESNQRNKRKRTKEKTKNQKKQIKNKGQVADNEKEKTQDFQLCRNEKLISFCHLDFFL